MTRTSNIHIFNETAWVGSIVSSISGDLFSSLEWKNKIGGIHKSTCSTCVMSSLTVSLVFVLFYSCHNVLNAFYIVRQLPSMLIVNLLITVYSMFIIIWHLLPSVINCVKSVGCLLMSVAKQCFHAVLLFPPYIECLLHYRLLPNYACTVWSTAKGRT